MVCLRHLPSDSAFRLWFSRQVVAYARGQDLQDRLLDNHVNMTWKLCQIHCQLRQCVERGFPDGTYRVRSVNWTHVLDLHYTAKSRKTHHE